MCPRALRRERTLPWYTENVYQELSHVISHVGLHVSGSRGACGTMMQAMNTHILIASDDQSFGMKMRDAIEREGIPAVDMPRTLAAQTISPHQLPSAVIIDV